MNEQVIIKNNRRSTSQVSVYDYPEHLNPFYEDENHKRLRFWKLGKKDGRDSRRGSFSFGGLKEMWTFKSFRLKKKPSSLGINKTSESPPPLRRYLEPNETNYGTYDPRLRHTVGIGKNGINGDSFQRNVPYRSSLQDMRNAQNIETNGYGIGFGRNDRYRSTIQTSTRSDSTSRLSTPQVPPRRYVYGGSITPQPRSRFDDCYNDKYQGISRGSSQISVASTNPFDEDDNDVVVCRLQIDENEQNNVKPTPAKRHKKKRRAPPPPIPIPKVIDEETQSLTASSPSASQTNQKQTEENVEITNLTAEIENFVKIKAEESDSGDRQKSDSPENNEVRITTTATINCENENNSDVPKENEVIVAEATKIIPTRNEDEVNNSFKLNISNGKISHMENNIEICKNPNEVKDDDIPISVFELKITESKEDISEKSEVSNDNIDKYVQIRYLPLKDSGCDPERQSLPEMRSDGKISNSQDHEILETNGIITYERRRSVKEIIESINRSQSLLKVNQDQLKTPSTVNNLNEPEMKAPPRKKADSKDQIDANLRSLEESEREIKKLIHDLEKENGDENISNDIKDFTNEINNNNVIRNDEIFKKCTIKKEFNRETSPTSSNLDWNPVPKPKRTKNLSVELGNINVLMNNNNEN